MNLDKFDLIDVIYVFLFSLVTSISIAAGFFVNNLTIFLVLLTIAFLISLILGMVEIWREPDPESEKSEKEETEYQQGYREGYRDGYRDSQVDTDKGAEQFKIVTVEMEDEEEEDEEEEDEEEEDEEGWTKEKMKETEKS